MVLSASCRSPEQDERFGKIAEVGRAYGPSDFRRLGCDFEAGDSIVEIHFHVTNGGRPTFEKICNFCLKFGFRLFDMAEREEIDPRNPEISEFYSFVTLEEELASGTFQWPEGFDGAR